MPVCVVGFFGVTTDSPAYFHADISPCYCIIHAPPRERAWQLHGTRGHHIVGVVVVANICCAVGNVPYCDQIMETLTARLPPLRGAIVVVC